MLAQALALAVTAAEEVKAKNPILPETKEIFWGGLAFIIVFTLLAWKAWPAIKKALQDREDKIRGDLEHAGVGPQPGRDRARRLPAPAGGRAQRGRSDHRGGPPVGRAGAQGPDRPGRGGRRRDPARRRRTTSAPRPSGRWPTSRARSSDLSIELAERIVQQNLDRATQIQLIENYINEVGGTRR